MGNPLPIKIAEYKGDELAKEGGSILNLYIGRCPDTYLFRHESKKHPCCMSPYSVSTIFLQLNAEIGKAKICASHFYLFSVFYTFTVIIITTTIKSYLIIIAYCLVIAAICSCKKAASPPACPGWAIWIPNSFSPNGDGLNDTFGPKLGNDGAKQFQMYIYDQLGEQLFSTSNPYIPWTGRPQGDSVICAQGTYLYKITATDSCGNSHNYSGTFTLMK